MKIYLIGYMGSGKSTLGQDLAAALEVSWLDLDDEFEQHYKVSIPSFFEKYGETAFRELEHKVLAGIAKIPDLVVSTGGGSPCYHDNMKLMNLTGITVYLKAMPELLISRIELSARKRPLFQQMQGENFLQKITMHLKSREPYYSQAKITIDAGKTNVEDLKKNILDYTSTISGV